MLPRKRLVLVVEGVAFRFANLLDNHLLGGLSGDATQEVADLVFFKGLAIDGRRRLPAVAVDVDVDLALFAEVLPGRGDDRLFDPFEHDLLVDVLIAMDRIDDSQDLAAVHGFPSALSRLGSHPGSVDPSDSAALVRILPPSRSPPGTSCPEMKNLQQKKRARVPLRGLPPGGAAGPLLSAMARRRSLTTFVKNDLSAFALVHAYISDALFKFRTSSIACTSKNPFPIGPHKRHRFAIWTCAILYPAPTADIRDVRQGSKRPFMTLLRSNQTVKQPRPSLNPDTWHPTPSQTPIAHHVIWAAPRKWSAKFRTRGHRDPGRAADILSA